MINITTIHGDGIGKEVMESGLKVLDALDLNLNYENAYAGRSCFNKIGTTLPEETVKTCKKNKATLFGAITSTPGEKSPIVTLRKELEVYGNLRPTKSFPGIKGLYDNIDLIIVRENTEGLYSQIEDISKDNTIATASRIITRKASRKICDLAFKTAIKNNYEKVSCIHKANVLRKTDGIFKECFYEVSENYPEIKTNDFYVDATAMYLITNPQMFDVIVTTNLFGDILSDEASGLVGGLGLAPSGNIGDKHGLFEPVHGSAPDIAGENIANPIAMILSISMMLDYLNFNYESKKLEEACLNVLKEGKYLTPDLGGNCKTDELVSRIIKELI